MNNYGIISHNIRDLFTAGGSFEYKSKNGKHFSKVPRIFKLLIDHRVELLRILFLNKHIFSADKNISCKRLIKLWIDTIYKFSSSSYSESKDLLTSILI
jgi:hypothetical protein